ncbi:hypothetical protein Bca101_098426 [Brassica carinata]
MRQSVGPSRVRLVARISAVLRWVIRKSLQLFMALERVSESSLYLFAPPQIQNKSQQKNGHALAINRDISCHPSDNGSLHTNRTVASFSGTRSACIINAATLVLADAGVPMRDLSVSCSAGYLNSTPLLDLNYVEDSAGGADVTVGILPKLDKVTLLQLPMETFETVFALASEGCKAIAERVRKHLTVDSTMLFNPVPSTMKYPTIGIRYNVITVNTLADFITIE